MEPRDYIPAYLEREYLASHEGLTPAARSLVHEEIRRDPARYATTEHAQALVAYARAHEHLMLELERMEELTDQEFEKRRDRLFAETRSALHDIARADRLCIDARLVEIMLANVPIDACLNDLMKLEGEIHEHLAADPAFDDDAPGYWREDRLGGMSCAERTRTDPVMIGWLHTLEAISQLAMASARYRASAEYAQKVMRARGYANRAYGTVLLALARLEDEDGFFAAARQADKAADAGADADTDSTDATPREPGLSDSVEDSPWYLLGRTLLLFKLGRRKNARRALKDFAARCEGGAFFLLNPTYLTPYLPVRPPVREVWELSHQAVWEADGIIVDTPDFCTWAAQVEGIEDISENFARQYGF